MCMRTLFVTLTAVLLVGAAVGGPVAAQQEDAVTLTVTLVDGNGDTVSNVQLQATWDGGSTNETTRSNGQALIDVPQDADVSIDVFDDQYVRNAPYEIDNAQGGSYTVEVARQGTATVQVNNRQGSVDNAIVELYEQGADDPVVDVRTDSSGSVTSMPIERGTYRLVTYKEGFLRNETTLVVTGDVSQTMRIEQGSVTARFSVADDHFSPAEPIEAASVEVPGAGTVQTQGNGETTVQVSVNREYEVTVTKDGYESVTRTLTVGEDDTRLDVAINRQPAITVRASSDRVIIGENTTVTVRNEYGNPVSGASVAVNGTTAGETGDNGQATVTIENEGANRIEVTAGDLTNATIVEAFDPSQPTDEGTDTATEAPGEATTDGSGPGFTPVLALVAVALAVLLARRY